jgi:photosystem II stability/assembly factor-like uncharacterized protein
MAVDPSNPAVLYAGTFVGGLYKTTNGGASWTLVLSEFTLPFIETVTVDPSNSAIILRRELRNACCGVFKSSNGGQTWTEMNSGLTNTYVHTIAIDPFNPSTVYTGTSGGAFKSLDGGSNWSPISSGLPGAAVNVIAIDPANHKTIYAGTWDGCVQEFKQRRQLDGIQLRTLEPIRYHPCYRSHGIGDALCRSNSRQHRNRQRIQERRWGRDLDGNRLRL